MSKFQEFVEAMEGKIVDTYEGVTIELAESLAAEFLSAQLQVSKELKKHDLNARMSKSGLKAIRAAVYTESAKLVDGKKPTEAAIAAMVDSDELVLGEQRSLDVAEVERDELDRVFNVFSNAHIFYRGVSKGRFE